METALYVYLSKLAQKSGSKDQNAIAEFAEAMLVIPKQLSLNAAKDATDLTSKLIALHSSKQNDPLNPKFQGIEFTGLDLSEGKVRNNLDAGVLEPMVSKIKSLKFATEAAIAILRIDDMIKIAQPKEEMAQRC